MDGGIYTSLFWIAQIGLGNLLPLALIYAPSLQQSSNSLVLACLLVIAGAFAQLYIIIVGGQAYPLNIFPGYVVESGFYDGVVGEYAPSLWEFMLGFGGLTAALLIALLVLRVLPIMPTALGAEGK
jgi:molybdopterin-containing oxidoreductase family membrane subunit